MQSVGSACGLAVVLALTSTWAWAQEPSASEPVAPKVTGHPRLYFTTAELEKLRADRANGERAVIWKNLAESAEWCLTKKPRTEWIAPVADDPIYENLYDRFYAMMMDMAITEHLAFAYALSGDAKYGDAARQWTLGCCRAWRPDADAKPDDGKAYAVMRLLKGVAVGYDMVYDRLSEEERREIREMLAKTASNYYRDYFNTAERLSPEFHTHHAHVQLSSFGVTALALLGEVPEARDWVALTTKKFEDDLLPKGLAKDGAQIEGATFWASTMHYRLFYMDALRRVTGKDLYKKYKPFMQDDLALASIACEQEPGWDEPQQTVVLSPSYGQLDYYAPILVALAAEYDRTIDQYLASWDHTLGRIQNTRFITPHKQEQLMFELGGYAYVWYSPRVPATPGDAALSYSFPSVRQAYARGSWKPDGLLAAMDRGGSVVVHAGGTAVLIASGQANESKEAPTIRDNKDTVTLEFADAKETLVSGDMKRPDRLTLRWRKLPASWSFWCLRPPEKKEDYLVWGGKVEMRFTKGKLGKLEPEGYAPEHAVGNGKLKLIDPKPMKYPVVYVAPDQGELQIDIRLNMKP